MGRDVHCYPCKSIFLVDYNIDLALVWTPLELAHGCWGCILYWVNCYCDGLCWVTYMGYSVLRYILWGATLLIMVHRCYRNSCCEYMRCAYCAAGSGYIRSCDR